MAKHRIAVFGAGDMGGALTEALAKRTKHVVGVRGSQAGSTSAQVLVESLGVQEANDDFVKGCDIVFVVVRAEAIPQVISELESYQGIVVSVSVSPFVGRDGRTSTAELLADALPEARVVNAFTSIWSTVVRDPGDGEMTSAFVCSDHDEEKGVISKLAEEIGFEAINGGKLPVALYAESLGVFAVRLALDSGYGQTISFRAFRAADF